MGWWLDCIRGPVIGRGSSATVSLATVRESGEIFALKSAELSCAYFLQREQRILSLLHCPQIVQYMGDNVTVENDRPLYNLFMEYVSGGSLSEVLKRQGGRLDEPSIRSHTRSILLGLDYLHSKRIAHCDIKGGNVLIGHDGAKIADLGCARRIDASGNQSPIAGTPVFMAPEVARGEEQGLAADLWALGCTVIEMATGCPPWPDMVDPVSALYRIGFSGDVPEFPGWISDQAKDFLSKCLRRDPKERWTADQLLKHPFVVDLTPYSKKICGSPSNSPTSILDQCLWDSLDEEQTQQNPTHIYSGWRLLAERIRLLSASIVATQMPNWAQDDNWITVRSNDGVEISSDQGNDDQILAESPMVGPKSIRIIPEEVVFCKTSTLKLSSCPLDCIVKATSVQPIPFIENQGVTMIFLFYSLQLSFMFSSLFAYHPKQYVSGFGHGRETRIATYQVSGRDEISERRCIWLWA